MLLLLQPSTIATVQIKIVIFFISIIIKVIDIDAKTAVPVADGNRISNNREIILQNGKSIPLHFAAQVFFFDRLAFVVLLLAPGKSNQKFCIAVVCDIELDCNDCKALFLYSPLKSEQFLAGKQKLAVTSGIMLAPSTPPIISNVHIFDIKLTIVEIAETIHQRGLSRPDGLYLGARKNDSRLEGLNEFVVKRCAPVLYLNFALCFRHNIHFLETAALRAAGFTAVHGTKILHF